MGAGVEEREGVVDAGIDVEDERLGVLSHASISRALMRSC